MLGEVILFLLEKWAFPNASNLYEVLTNAFCNVIFSKEFNNFVINLNISETAKIKI